MNWLLMRFEILVLLMVLFSLLWEIVIPPEKKRNIVPVVTFLFGFITLSGFFFMPSGELFGGHFYTDPLLCLMKNILNVAVFIVLLQSWSWLQKEENRDRIGEFYLLLFATLAGMFFMISARSFLMMYVGLELASIPVAMLAAYDRHNHYSAEAGIKYILMSALSSGILLFGLSFIYAVSGSMFFSAFPVMSTPSSVTLMGLVFFISGMGFKIAFVPFHFWAPDVYQGAPVSVTSYLSTVSKGAAVFTLMIALCRVFAGYASLWQPLLYGISIATMTIGNLFALRQQNLKRFLAFSSIAQAGFILLGLLGSHQTGMAAVIYFILIYVFTNLAAFGVVSLISMVTAREEIDDYRGLYRTNPLLSLVMMLSMFSLAGIPPLAGFFAKFFLFSSAASKGYYILVLIAVLNATVSLYYYLRVVKAMFIDVSENPVAFFVSDLPSKIALGICVAGIFLAGFISRIYDYIVSVSMGL